jgi:hypothetical protein
MNASRAQGLAAAWALLMAFSIVNTVIRGLGDVGFTADLLIVPALLLLALAGARVAKGESLMGSHRLAVRELVEAHGGDADGGRLRSSLAGTIHGVSGRVSLTVSPSGISIVLRPDPPLHNDVVIHSQAPEDSPTLPGGERFPRTQQPALLRGEVRGPAEILAPALDRQLRDDLDSALPTYRLLVVRGALHATVPMSWKSARVALAVEELFELAGRLAVSTEEAPARLLAIVEEDPDPAFRHAAADVLFEHHRRSPQAETARAGLLVDRDPDLVRLAQAQAAGRLTVLDDDGGELSLTGEGALALAGQRPKKTRA